MDNTSKENKNQYVFAFLTYLVDKGVFKTIYVSFLIPGHTHEDIDQCFSVLTKALRNNTAYTFAQWKNVVHDAFKDDFNKIHNVEYLWSTLDYKTWLSKQSVNSYQDYRSTAYHFRIRKTSENRPAITQYTQFCYEGDYSVCSVDAHYFPSIATSTAYSFLQNFLEGEPDVDLTAGTWLEKKQGGDDEIVDGGQRLQKILELLKLETNSASLEDEQWWEMFWSQKPVPGKTPNSDQTWNFRLPNVEGVNRNCSAEYMDIHDLGDVKPLSPFKHEMLVTKNWSRSSRRDAIKLAESYKTMAVPGELVVGEFVVFKVEQPEWSDIASDQSGVDPNVLSTNFGVGKIVEKIVTGEEVGGLCVHVWYAVEGGNPNGRWLPWLRKSELPKEKKTTPWIKEIPAQSVLLTGITLKHTNKHTYRLSRETKKSIHEHPDIPYRLLAHVGLVPQKEEVQTLEEIVTQTKGARSKSGRRRHKTSVTKLNKSKQHQHISKVLHNRKLRAAKNSIHLSEKVSNAEEHLQEEEIGSSLHSSSSSSDHAGDEPENYGDEEEIPKFVPSSLTSGKGEDVTNLHDPEHMSLQTGTLHVQRPRLPPTTNQRYGFRDQSQDLYVLYSVGEEVMCRYRRRNTFYKARIEGYNAKNGTYRVSYVEFVDCEDNVKPFLIQKLDLSNLAKTSK